MRRRDARYCCGLKASCGYAGMAPGDEQGLVSAGYLVSLDKSKVNANESLLALTELGLAVKVTTGDNPRVAAPAEPRHRVHSPIHVPVRSP